MEYSIKIVIISKKDWEYPRIGNIQEGLGIFKKDWEYPKRIGNSQERLGIRLGNRGINEEYTKRIGKSQ